MGYAKVNGKWVEVQSDPRLNLKSKKVRNEERLLEIAKKSGLGQQADAIVNKKPKLSALQRIVEGVNLLNPTGALYRKSVGQEADVFVGYIKDIAQRARSAFTGEIPNRQIATGSDLAGAFGIKNKLAKPIVGFAADVLLDPATYIPGGAILKGAGKVVKPGLRGVEAAAKLLAPGRVEAIKEAGVGIKDALGKAFVRGYKATPGLLDETTDVLGEANKIQRGIAEAQGERVAGTSAATRKKVGEDVADVRIRTLKEEEAARKKYVEEYNRITGSKETDISPSTAQRLIQETEDAAAKKTDRLQRSIEYLQKDITKNETSDLQKLIDDLHEELKKTVPGKKQSVVSAAPATFRGTEDLLTSTINLNRREMQETIGALTAKLNAAKKGLVKAGEAGSKIARETFSEKITRLNREILRVQDEAVKRSRVLGAIADSRKIARAKTDKLLPILRQDLSPVARRLAEKLQQAGKDIPLQFRDLKAEALRQGQVSLARKTGEDLVAAGELGKETIPNVYYPLSAKKTAGESAGFFQRKIGPGGQQYLKQVKGALGKDSIELDIGTAIGSRRAEVVADIFKKKKLKELVGKYGGKFSSDAEAKAAGYVPINSKGLASTIGETIGYVTKEDADLLGAFMGKQEFETLDKLAKAFGFDFFTGIFKRSVTALFPAFHVRNWLSGIVQNYEILGPKALNPANMGAGFRIAKKILENKSFGDEVLEIGGKKIKYEVVKSAIEHRFFGGSSAADLMDSLSFLSDKGKVFSVETLKKTAKSLGTSSEALPLRAARKVGESIEMQQKATAVVTALRQGKTLQEALSLAREAAFDYRQLTGFESKIMRRIIPFYSFARFNAELQVKTLLKNPARIGAVVKTAQNVGQATQEERESMPEFLQKTFGIRFGEDKYGNPQFITSLGTPVEAFADWFDKDPLLKIISNMNPIFKVPTEIGIGKDSFRKRDIKDVYTAREFSSAPQIVKDLLQIKPVEKVRFVNGKPTKEKYTVYVADPYRLLIVRSLPTSRGITFLDQAFDGDVRGLAKTLNLLTGIKTVPLDVERYAELKQRDEQRALEDLLIRYGVAREFRNVYIPKAKPQL